MFSDLTERMLAFWRTMFNHFKGGFQILQDFKLALGLEIHTRFDDLDPISRSQVCKLF